VRIIANQPGAALDRVLLTDDAAFVPLALTVEAERGSYVPPMSAGGSFWSTRYMWVPTGGGSGGIVDLQTPVITAGRYAIWARVSAPSSAHNSFAVSANLGPAAEWDTPIATATSAWSWGQVTTGVDHQPYLFTLNESNSFVRF